MTESVRDVHSIEKLAQVERMSSLTAERISQWQQVCRKSGQSESTIKNNSGHLRAALNWAKDVGIVSVVPKIRMPKRAKSSKLTKGRPITAEEFERIIDKVPAIVGPNRAESWCHLFRGLWWSGLRISEAMTLTWDGQGMRVDLSNDSPMLLMPAECQKSHKGENSFPSLPNSPKCF